MEDQHLDRLLRELPREPARRGFTARVLAGLDAPPALPSRPRFAAAAAALATLVLAIGVSRWEHGETRRAVDRAQARRVLEQLRAEHGELKREIEALHDAPVVYVGGNEDVDLVAHPRDLKPASGSQPATYRYDTY